MTVQRVTRVADDVLAAVDRLVEEGVFAPRSEAVRAGLAVVEKQCRETIGNAMVEGYRRIPQQGDDLGWTDAVSAAMITEEPW